MKFIVVIPARMQSSRLPGKPLKMIGDKPMLQWVCEQALASQAEHVIVATDHQDIADIVKPLNVQICMTGIHHNSGTERIAEVIEQTDIPDETIIVNVQGDEPLIPPENINQVANNLAKISAATVATLSAPILSEEEWLNPNVVKVVCDRNHIALYFSRTPIPSGNSTNRYRHIGIYAYRAGFLKQYVGWPRTELEQIESLEQLRILWYGHKIHVEQAKIIPPTGVDTPADLENIKKLIKA